MPEHDRSVDGARWGRCPAARDAGIEQLVGSRAMVPHGDAVDAAESRRVVDAVVVGGASDDVVRVLVLHDDLDELVT